MLSYSGTLSLINSFMSICTFFPYKLYRRIVFEILFSHFMLFMFLPKIYFRDRQYFAISNQLPYDLHNFTCYIELNTHIYILELSYDEKQFNKLLSNAQNDSVEFPTRVWVSVEYKYRNYRFDRFFFAFSICSQCCTL